MICHSYQVREAELLRWRGSGIKMKWLFLTMQLIPLSIQFNFNLFNSIFNSIQHYDCEFYPNIHQLLRILCTLPITSAECKRSFSTLHRLKTYLRSTTSADRESDLALMNVHYHINIDINTVVDPFSRKHLRRMLLADILADD